MRLKKKSKLKHERKLRPCAVLKHWLTIKSEEMEQKDRLNSGNKRKARPQGRVQLAGMLCVGSSGGICIIP